MDDELVKVLYDKYINNFIDIVGVEKYKTVINSQSFLLLNYEINSEMNINRRIMIVDDEPYNLLGLQIVIQQTGVANLDHLIDKASNGEQALNLVKDAFKMNKFSYGLIFMDCSMPIMNGYDATEAIRTFAK